MTSEQRAETFEAFKAKVNETDAARRDAGWAEAMARGQRIAELEAENRRLKAALAVYEDHSEEGFTP